MILNSIFDKTVTVSRDEIFDGCEFRAKGANNKDTSSMGVKILGGNVVIRNSKFENVGYGAVNYKTGNIVLENNEFICAGVKNPIEGMYKGAGALCGDMVIKGNHFVGNCGNNYINFYQFTDGAHIVLEDNVFDNVNVDSEIIRISNTNSAKDVVIDVKGDSFHYDDAPATEYTSYLLYQDDSVAGAAEDFTGIKINLQDVKCNGVALVADKAPVKGETQIMYRKNNGGLVEIDENNPVLTIA